MGTWSLLSDVNNFFNTYNHTNRYYGLKLGNYVTINDGTYNVDWVIAGFNCEHNGYGICMIPKTDLGSMKWNDTTTLTDGYKSSTMNTSHLVTVANNLKTVLGTHLINRNVLLSSANDDAQSISRSSSAYEWTTAYCTLMSVGQMNGIFKQNDNKYDDGEANYKLPLFDYEDYWINNSFWTRGICGTGHVYALNLSAWRVAPEGSLTDGKVDLNYYVRPLIYLR